MVLPEFSMSSPEKGESMSSYVLCILKIIGRSGITYKLTLTVTILKGKWDEVMRVVGSCIKELE